MAQAMPKISTTMASNSSAVTWVTASFAAMVTVAARMLPSPAPLAVVRDTVNDSLFSGSASLMSATRMVRADASPLAQDRVPCAA